MKNPLNRLIGIAGLDKGRQTTNLAPGGGLVFSGEMDDAFALQEKRDGQQKNNQNHPA